MAAGVGWRGSGSTQAEPDERFALDTLWHELMAGTRRVMEASLSEESCVLTLEQVSASSQQPVPEKTRRALEDVLDGNARKAVAADLGVSAATLAGVLQQALAYLGLTCTPAKLPLFLVLALYASKGRCGVSGASQTRFTFAGRQFSIVRVPRPDDWLLRALPPAEAQVAQLIVEANSHAEIARRRGTSQRTVANQVARIFAKLSVSNRLELLGKVAAHAP